MATALTKQDEPVSDMTGGLLAVIERAARDPNVDIDKMERLYLMQERVLLQEAKASFNGAMSLAQAEMPRIYRNGKNNTTNSTYAEAEQLSKLSAPIITKHGFSLSYGTAESHLPDHYRVTCICAREGYEREYILDVPIDNEGMKGAKNKTNTHGFGSAMSYGKRYLKLMIFDIATTDDDGQRAGQTPPISVAQYNELLRRMSETETASEDFAEYMKIKDLSELPSGLFNRAIAALAAKAAKNKVKG